MKNVAAIEASSVAIARAQAVAAESTPALAPGQCPACGSGASELVLEAESTGERRSLFSCSRCGLLRFLGDHPADAPGCFADLVHFEPSPLGAMRRVRYWFRRFALQSKLRFVRRALFRPGSQGFVLDCDGADGTASRALESFGAQALVIGEDPNLAVRAHHRQGIYAIAANPANPPILEPLFDAVCRLRHFAHEPDPVQWAQSARLLLRDGGRIVVQAYDSASWAFLIAGSRWAGLEAAGASFAYRGVDIEVLFDYCGLRIVRRSHFFPLLNTCVWISSLFPKLDPARRTGADRQVGWRGELAELSYMLLVVLALPLGFVESVCHAGSVLMVEAEPK